MEVIDFALSARYQRTYAELLELLGSRCDVLPKDVCLHWPMHQPTYTGTLLVIGQAPNGWLVDAPACDLDDPVRRASLLAETRSASEGTTAFDWMRPRVRSRPFWRLVDEAMAVLGLTLGEIAWSNLAKVAPDGGNPTGEFLWTQYDHGGRLLRLEVDELDPALVLVVSGRGYTEPFLTAAGLTPAWSRRGARQFDGMLGGRRWLVLNHPGTFAYRYEASRMGLIDSLQR